MTRNRAITKPVKPETTIKRYFEESIKRMKFENPGIERLMRWEDSFMVEHPANPERDFDVIVHLFPGNRWHGAHAVAYHPELGHWAVNLNGPRQWNVGKPSLQRTAEQMKHDVEIGVNRPLWPHLGY